MNGRARVPPPRSAAEKRVLNAYVLALARGKYRNRMEAARDYQRNLERLRRRYPHAAWLQIHRTLNGIRRAMYERGRALKLPLITAPLTSEEHQLLTSYARKVVAGRFPEVRLAAMDYMQRIDDLRKKHPELTWTRVQRTFETVRNLIAARSHKLGWPYRNVAWSPQESRVLNRYARDLIAGRYIGAKQAAVKAEIEIGRLHRDNQGEHWALARRSHTALWVKIERVASDLAKSRPNSPWTPEEDRVVERHARALVQDRYRDGRQAAQSCWIELARRRSRLLRRKGKLPMAPTARTLRSVSSRLLPRAGDQEWGGRRPHWSSAEIKVAQKWERRFKSHRGQRGVLTFKAAARALMLDLSSRGFRRSQVACTVWLARLVWGRKNEQRIVRPT